MVTGSLTVSSVQMEWTWVPNITEVKMRKRRPSKHRSMRRITVAGGEKVLHSGGMGGSWTQRSERVKKRFTEELLHFYQKTTAFNCSSTVTMQSFEVSKYELKSTS